MDHGESARLTRRRVLLALAGSTALGAGGLALSPGEDRPAPEGLRGVPPAAFGALWSIARAAVPPACADEDVTHVATAVGDAIARLPKRAQDELSLLLRVMDNGLGAVALGAGTTPLSAADGAGFLEALGTHRVAKLRGAYHGLRRLCLAAYWATPRLQATSGYPGPRLTRPIPPASPSAALAAPGWPGAPS